MRTGGQGYFHGGGRAGGGAVKGVVFDWLLTFGVVLVAMNTKHGFDFSNWDFSAQTLLASVAFATGVEILRFAFARMMKSEGWL